MLRMVGRRGREVVVVEVEVESGVWVIESVWLCLDGTGRGDGRQYEADIDVADDAETGGGYVSVAEPTRPCCDRHHYLCPHLCLCRCLYLCLCLHLWCLHPQQLQGSQAQAQ
jgi:hypothetical protein